MTKRVPSKLKSVLMPALSAPDPDKLPVLQLDRSRRGKLTLSEAGEETAKENASYFTGLGVDEQSRVKAVLDVIIGNGIREIAEGRFAVSPGIMLQALDLYHRLFGKQQGAQTQKVMLLLGIQVAQQAMPTQIAESTPQDAPAEAEVVQADAYTNE